MADGIALGFVGLGWFPDAGGVESHTRDLARELRARGHRVHALVLDGREGLEPYRTRVEEADGVRVTRMAYRYHDHRALADLVKSSRAETVAVEWARTERLELVHVHHASGWGLGILPALRERVALAMTLHDYWPLCPRGQMLRTDGEPCLEATPARCAPCLGATWRHLMPESGGASRGPRGEELATDPDAAAARTEFALRCLGAPQRLFTPSPAARAVFERAGVPAGRIVVVENGIDVAELARETERLRRARPTLAEVRLGVLGTVLPSKGALELARAFLAADAPGLVLEIHGALPSYHGDERYVDELRALAAREPRVRVHGPFRHDDLARILSGLDGVAAPSRWNEVYGLTVREARAAGLPVLVSSAGALPDVLTRDPSGSPGCTGGLVVPAEDRSAWTAALERFADPDERARWSAPGAPPRSAREMALELEDHYRAMLRERAGPLRRFLRALFRA